MTDFTLKIYRIFLSSLQSKGYTFVTYEDFCDSPDNVPVKFIILRHDVDLKAINSLRTAQVEAELGIRGSYYFRVVPQSNKPEIILAVAALGHEIGYHYEDMTIFNGNSQKAIDHFKKQLNYFRQFYPVRTITMHGSPASVHDNRDLWKSYDYRTFDLIGEPYFDLFPVSSSVYSSRENKVYYLTDTGRMWNGQKFSVRDKINDFQILDYKTTPQLIEALQAGKLPDRIMVTIHPQRWSDNRMEWIYERSSQWIKNFVKGILIKVRYL